jgi:peptidoglycan/LPS O-acetylase OafA/YrhL
MTRYRPQLDGIRAIAITLVLVDHFVASGSKPSGLGHVGVGLFFALSGYLITGLLLSEHERGPIDLPAFFARRAGRLFPGLIVMLAVTMPVLASTKGWRNTGESALATLTYTANYADITGWLHASVYGQTWSLAVEEHFYLLWAPVLAYAARRGGASAVLRYALIGAAASVVSRIAVGFIANNWLWVARGSFVRGDALLIGCAAAAAVQLGRRPPLYVLPVSLAGLVAACFVLPGSSDGHAVRLAFGLIGLSFVAAGLVIGVDQADGYAARILSLRPVVWLGMVSYSLYLWHLPILVAGAHRWSKWTSLAATLIIATASYLLVERPSRNAVRGWLAVRRPVRQIQSAEALTPVAVAPSVQSNWGAQRRK